MASENSPRTDLTRLFNPRSVAFVGATEDQSKFGGRCLANLLSFGFGGTVMPVNPKRRELFGHACYPSVAELPSTPDHVGICLPANAALEALEQCGQRGVAFATVFTSGFLETGDQAGRDLHARLRHICDTTGLRVMGPNCNGLASFTDRFALTSTAGVQGPREPSGDVAIVSQSGGAGQINTLWRARQAGLRISYQASTGNDADLDLLDFMDFMLDSEQTSIVLSVAERFSSPAKLKAVAEKSVRLQKPIVMVKVGRSEAGSRAAASHTGAVSGADEVCDAILREYGIIRVEDTTDLVEYAKLLRRSNRPTGGRTGLASISGGNVVLGVDAASSAGLEIAELGADSRQALQTVLPGSNPLGNPIDMTATAIGVDDALLHVAKTMIADPQVDLFVAVVPMGSRASIEVLAEYSLVSPKPLVILWPGGCLDDPSYTQELLVQRGIPVFRDSVPCFRSIAASIGAARFRTQWLADQAEDAAAPAAPARKDIDVPRTSGVLTERLSKNVLSAFGIPPIAEVLAASADDAVAIAARIGRPVALKIESPDIAHKTEAGAIRLNVTGDAAVRQAFDDVTRSAKAYAPNAKVHGVLVQEMAGSGIELFLGLLKDPAFGPVITVGAGGIYVEVHRDLAYATVPVSRRQARALLGRLRIWPILEGYRGQPAFDIEAAIDCICALSDVSVSQGDWIAEIDINPLIVRPVGQGACMVDALIIAESQAAVASD